LEADVVIAADRVRQFVCGLHGHDALLQFAAGRMFLRCVSCGHETPGWNLDETPPTPTGAVHDARALAPSRGWLSAPAK
jgi:hypothetical protein